jgi:predicted transcriptional regulator
MDGTCVNPRCTCSPCGCDECRCGSVRLGELERRVMEVLWDHPDEELTGREIADVLPSPAYTTLVTVLDRLSHKGMVSRTLVGRINFYRGTMTRAAFAAGAMLDVLHGTADRGEALGLFTTGLDDAEARRLYVALGRRTSRS